MKRALGIDLGEARIGLAISDELRFLAHPLETIHVAKTPKPLERIAQLVRERDVDFVVVGLPRHMNGTLGTAAEEALRFVEKLKAKVSCPVETWDERLTTVAAQKAVQQSGKKMRESRGYLDQVAAQMILQGYLDRTAGS